MLYIKQLMAEDPFDTLVTAHHGEIYRFLRRVTGRRDVAEDLLHDTFLRALRAFPTLDEASNPRAWLFVIATNVARNHARGERRAERAKKTFAAQRRHTVPVNGGGLKDLQMALQRAILALPPKQRLAFTLRKFHHEDYEVIASCVRCSRACARAHVFQALKTLRRRLAGELNRGRP